jgi:hypothetical protein
VKVRNPPRSVEVAAGPAPVASAAAAKTRTGEAASCAQISSGGVDVGGRPDRNVGDWEGGAGGRDTGDRCGAVGWLSRSGPETMALADSARAGPMAEVVPGATGRTLMAVAQVASARACPTMDQRSSSTLRGNRGQAGGLTGGGAGLHTHGPSGTRSSSPDEMGWLRHRWTWCSPAQFGKSDVRPETAINDLSY